MDRLFAPHYAAAVLRSVVRQAPLRAVVNGYALSEVLIGEPFEVLELTKGNAWGTSPIDGAVGFVEVDALGPHIENMHVVGRGAAGSPPIGSRLPNASEATLPPGEPVEDFVTVAEGLAKAPTPVRHGGRSGAGVDAAGLVFLSLSLAGIRAPRFADLQQGIGHPVADTAPLLRGDLLFADAGPAIAVDGEYAIYVTEHVVRGRIADLGSITARRRLP